MTARPGRTHRQWIMVALGFVLGGCALKLSQRSPWDVEQLQALSEQLEQFKGLAQLKADEAEQLRQAKELLEQRLASEIDAKQVSVGFDDRGLVVRVLDKILFDSGKATLRPESHAVLDKVAKVLKQDLPNQPIGIEGHTDNVPIKYSKWSDNYELSLARANSVVDYLTQKRGVEAGRVVPVGHGEERPIASNDTAQGRRMNRRVEIVVLPQGTVQEGSAAWKQRSQPGATAYTK